MAQIRQTIELLADIFHENGTLSVKAETFRQAKFDYPEAVKKFWHLLFELLYYCEHATIDEVTAKALNQLSDTEVVVYVKQEIQRRGFYSYEFVSLPNDMQSGSRELLLALGWLLCKEQIITRFMMNRTSPLNDESMPQAIPFQEIPDAGGDVPATPRDPVDRVHHLLWLNNKLRLSLRTLHSLQKERHLLQHRIYNATYGVSTSPERNHLSMLEVYMLRHPELLEQNLSLLEKDNQRLQNLLKWRDHEEIFWKWMESVLDTKLQQQQETQKSAGDSAQAAVAALKEASVKRLHESRFNLQEAIVKYETIVEHIESIWNSKINDVTEEELDSVLVSLELEISIQQANIALNNCEDYLSQQQQPARAAPRFVYEKQSSTSRSSASESVASGGTADTLNDIQEEIGHLQQLVEQLQLELEARQDSFQSEMTSLAQKLQDSITIPPMDG